MPTPASFSMEMPARPRLLAAALLIALCLISPLLHAQPAPKRPNIIIIYIDDLSRGDVGAFGCPESVTPNIDRLAEGGVKMTTAYTHNAPCSPSRAALMMGMYTQRFAIYPGHEGPYHPREYLRATLYALDVQIGRLLDKLDEMGLRENTLIFFSSDNGGDPVAGHRPQPYRGGKRDYNMQWEGNCRMPTIVSFPGKLKPGQSYDGMSTTIDFYPTAARLAGVSVPEHCEGIDLMPLLRGDTPSDPERILFWNTYGSQIVRWKQWRAVQYRLEKSWRLPPSLPTSLKLRRPGKLRRTRRPAGRSDPMALSGASRRKQIPCSESAGRHGSRREPAGLPAVRSINLTTLPPWSDGRFGRWMP